MVHMETYPSLDVFQIDQNEVFEMESYPTEIRLNHFEFHYLYAYRHRQ